MTDSVKTLAEDEIRVYCTEWLSRCGARFEETFDGSGDWTHLEVNVIRDMIEMYKDGYLAAQKNGEDKAKHLQFIYERLVNVYGEHPNYDYMIKLKEIFESLKHTP